jgi:hypothetical protein
MRVTVRRLLIAALAIGLRGENYIRVDSGGRYYVIDADSHEVQKNLKPADPQAGENNLPAWLYPYAGAAPLRANYDVRTGIASANFSSGGTVDQIVAYYAQLFRSRGYVTSGPMGSANSRVVSGKNAAGNVSTIVSSFRGEISVRVTFAPSREKSGKKHFKAAWYDEARGLLCLEDTSTGAQYYLDKGAILEANLNRPGGVKSAGAAMPAWLAVYPGAQPKKVQMAFGPNITFVTRDPMRTVYEWYVRTVENAGATVTDRGFMRSGTPAEDFSAHIEAVRGDDKVEIRMGKVFQPFTLGVPPPPKDQIGIGIRYSVPLR